MFVKFSGSAGNKNGDKLTSQRNAGKKPRSKGTIDIDTFVSNIFENAWLSSFCSSPSDKALNL